MREAVPSPLRTSFSVRDLYGETTYSFGQNSTTWPALSKLLVSGECVVVLPNPASWPDPDAVLSVSEGLFSTGSAMAYVYRLRPSGGPGWLDDRFDAGHREAKALLRRSIVAVASFRSVRAAPISAERLTEADGEDVPPVASVVPVTNTDREFVARALDHVGAVPHFRPDLRDD